MARARGTAVAQICGMRRAPIRAIDSIESILRTKEDLVGIPMLNPLKSSLFLLRVENHLCQGHSFVVI
jgi:hypothetical protein